MSDALEAEINRGQKAAQLLAEPLIAEAFAVFANEVQERWSKSPARDAEGREKLYLMLKAAERVQAHLSSLIESGKLAEATLKQRVAHATGRASVAF
jgi:hypothetical protein